MQTNLWKLYINSCIFEFRDSLSENQFLTYLTFAFRCVLFTDLLSTGSVYSKVCIAFLQRTSKDYFIVTVVFLGRLSKKIESTVLKSTRWKVLGRVG